MLLNLRGAVVDEKWQRLPEGDDPATAGGHLMVTPGQLAAHGDQLEKQVTGLGVALSADDDLQVVLSWLPSLGAIEITFGQFADGRGFSLARRLRQRYGFSGELRAAGQFIPDQMQYLEQCGFTHCVVEADATMLFQGQPRFTAGYRYHGFGG